MDRDIAPAIEKWTDEALPLTRRRELLQQDLRSLAARRSAGPSGPAARALQGLVPQARDAGTIMQCNPCSTREDDKPRPRSAPK
jgi:hypothetical protein